MGEVQQPDYFGIAKGIANAHASLVREGVVLSNDERQMYELEIQQWKDVVKAQDKMIKTMQELIETLKKAMA